MESGLAILVLLVLLAVVFLHQLGQRGIIHEVRKGRSAEQVRYYLDEKFVAQDK